MAIGSPSSCAAASGFRARSPGAAPAAPASSSPQPIEVDQVLAVARGATTPRVVAPRAPRFAANLAARLINEGHPYRRDRGEHLAERRPHPARRTARADHSVTLTIPGLQPRRCTVRWSKDQTVGLAFMDMVPYDELAAVLGHGVAQG
jgi:hypothetical protein